jgi:diguanylate cyclase (GGDEF)-like protein
MSLPSLCRFVNRLILGALLLIAGIGSAPAQQVLRLSDSVASVDAWPAVTLQHDPEGKLGIAEAIAARDRFAKPVSAYATLGLRQKVVWLRIPVAIVAPSDDEWMLDVDYTLLNRIDVYVVHDGQVERHAELGNLRPFAQRPYAGRSHAVELELKPGQTYDLLMRIETQGSMILPISLSKPSVFHGRAIDEQMLQGLLTCLGLCLLFYSLLQWTSLRESLYVKYALLVLCSMMFSVHFFGIGAQYLWTDNVWMERHMAGITSLMAACATALFIEDVLRSDTVHWLRRAMRVLAGVLLLAAAGHALGLLDIYQVSLIMSTLGLAPALMGLPGAIARVRRGDSVGAYFIVAWIGYFIASAIMVGVVKGQVGAGFWTMHAFQFGATFDMIIFMRIAVLRSTAIHIAAQRASLERDSLHSMAHSDPLTGLLNRRGLNTTLSSALPNSSPEKMLAVYMLDLDQFKPVNDQYGHDVGDELLVVAAKRLRATMRTGDVVARVGGDEFIVMAAGLQNDAQAIDLGNKLLDAFRAPFALSQRTCRVGVTIGYVLAPVDGYDAMGLLKLADEAMYAGKEDGKNCLRRGKGAEGSRLIAA